MSLLWPNIAGTMPQTIGCCLRRIKGFHCFNILVSPSPVSVMCRTHFLLQQSCMYNGNLPLLLCAFINDILLSAAAVSVICRTCFLLHHCRMYN